MPELPDLEVFSANLSKLFKGKKVTSVKVINGKNLKDPVAKLKKGVEGKTLEQVYRSGKELRFDFGDATLGLHLMLHGNLYVVSKSKEQKHTIAELHFNNDKGLAVTDWQGKANIRLNPEDKKGVDALSKELTVKYLAEVMQSKAIVKNLLMNQDIIRGIGNAYADEILWKAGISPLSVSNKIPAAKVRNLAKVIKQVLKDAVKHIKKTNPGLVTGEVRDFLSIHNSKKKTSPTGGEIKSGSIGGRKTYYTEEQQLYH
jgi:formamidopyrimidine-DNA glycosylase